MHGVLESIKKENRDFYEHEAMDLFASYGISVPRHGVAHSVKEAKGKAQEIGFPVAMKIISKDILHKSDVGGVEIALKDHDEVEQAYYRILKNVKENNSQADIHGILVVEMLKPDLEVILGVVRDSQLGSAMMFGMGGVMVELMKDISFALLPMNEGEASNMILKTKIGKIIEGYRGSKAYDKKSLVNLMVSLSKLALDYPEITQIDLNPVFLYREGLAIADFRLMTK